MILYCPYTGRLPAYPFIKGQQTAALKHCSKPDDYEDGLKELWSVRADLIIIEHDIVANDTHIRELTTCPYMLCAFAYRVYQVTTGLAEARYVHAKRMDGEYVWIEQGEEWADHVGFGFTKLGRLARQEIQGWSSMAGSMTGDWRNLDTRVTEAFNAQSFRFHIHWPEVDHDHKG